MKLLGSMLFILCFMFSCEAARIYEQGFLELPVKQEEVRSTLTPGQQKIATWGRFKGLREDEIPTLVQLYSNMDETHKTRLVSYAIAQMENHTNKYNTCYELGEGMFSVGLEYCF